MNYYGLGLPGSMLYNAPQQYYMPQYNDPSAAGGACRTRCHSQSNPGECCRVKNMLPNCKDADCAGPMFTGTTQAPPVYTYPGYTYPQYSYPQYTGQLGQYVAPGAFVPQTLPITTTPPALTYGTQDFMLSSMPNQYIVPPQFTTYTNTYGTFLPPSLYANPYGASLLASDCNSWPPCYMHANPGECCRLKPRTCYDQDCIGGSYTGRLPITIDKMGIKPLPGMVTPGMLPAPGADCRTWTPCHLAADPDQCCAAKPPGCDINCAGSRYMGPRKRGVYQIAYDGSSFSNDYDADVDEMYGVK